MSSMPTFKKPLIIFFEDPGQTSASNITIGKAYNTQPVQFKVDNNRKNDSNK